MKDFIFLMHDDATAPVKVGAWPGYFLRLRAAGAFQGGSAIGSGVCVRKEGAAPATSDHLGGYLRIEAADLDAARALLPGNPVFEAGGTIEIRELPREG
jgi:hypothetical protein